MQLTECVKDNLPIYIFFYFQQSASQLNGGIRQGAVIFVLSRGSYFAFDQHLCVGYLMPIVFCSCFAHSSDVIGPNKVMIAFAIFGLEISWVWATRSAENFPAL